jgi:hypothetical protein
MGLILPQSYVIRYDRGAWRIRTNTEMARCPAASIRTCSGADVIARDEVQGEAPP